jgi:hypothetical protein
MGSVKALLAAASEMQILESTGLRGVGGGVTSQRRHVVFPMTGNVGRRLAQERLPVMLERRWCLHSPSGGGARRVREECGLREGFPGVGNEGNLDCWLISHVIRG